jgi:hypothetical protein
MAHEKRNRKPAAKSYKIPQENRSLHPFFGRYILETNRLSFHPSHFQKDR